MRRYLLLAAMLSAAASAPANAQVIGYSDITNFTGSFFSNAGTASVGGILTTQSVMDHIHMVAFGGQASTLVVFSVSNNNAVSVSARPRIRFYDDDGPGGSPGTLLAAFTFNPIAFPANGLQLFNFAPGAGTFTYPTDGSFWASEFFDGSGTTATAAQLDNLGQLIFDPPTIGTSEDNIFVSAGAGVFGNNPPGATTNFGGSPIANLGWQFQAAPEPGSMAFMGVAAIGGLWRLRRKKKA